MFAAIFSILINMFILSCVETIPTINDASCSISKIGCNCQNIENITKESVETCCQLGMKTLLISGLQVKNILIDVRETLCSKNFQILMIRDTGVIEFDYPFYGLDNISTIYIEKNQHLNSFKKLYFSEISSKIDSISVEYNSIRSIDARTFSNMPSLVNLKLSDNKIGFIEDYSFANLTNLSSLHLNSNFLFNLNADIFYGLEKLKILSMLNNFLREFKQDVFKHLTNLRFLVISLNSTDIPTHNNLPDRMFFAVKRLKSLNMTLKIKDLTSLTFYGLYELESLDLQGNQLTVIPSGALQQVPKVITINLSRNQLRCLLPDTFRSLPRLISLDLSFNDLTYISEEVFSDLSNLQMLDLSENNIYVMEKNAFAGLKFLLIFKMTVIQGKAKNEVENNFLASPLAKLQPTTKIMGLTEFYGISSGRGALPDLSTTKKSTVNDLESRKNFCPSATASDRDWIDNQKNSPSKYLLIIVGICVVFLLIAFAIIMSYRAWSKRKMSDLTFNVEDHEKQEMLLSKSTVVNGRPDSKPHSKSNQTRKSLNGTFIPDVSDEKKEAKPDSFSTSQAQQPNSQASIKPATCPLSNERNHSDDESALTPLGVL